MNCEVSEYPIDNQDYFGVSLMNVGLYGAYLMKNSFDSSSHSALYFTEAGYYYHGPREALTIEGLAESPVFAIQAILAHAKVAREMDELAQPFAS